MVLPGSEVAVNHIISLIHRLPLPDLLVNAVTPATPGFFEVPNTDLQSNAISSHPIQSFHLKLLLQL